MEKQKKSYGAIALVILLLILTIVSLILATYAWAKYTSTRTGSATAQVAQWDVTFEDNANGSLTHTASHVVDGKIAPGTDGTFGVTVKPSSSEVCFNYSIQITGIDFIAPDNSVLPLSTVLDNNGTTNDATDDIKLSDLKSHIMIKDTNASGTDLTSGANVISGTYDLTGNSHNGSAYSTATNTTKTIYWTWPFELTDAQAKANVEAKAGHSGEATAEEIAAEKAAYNKIDTAAGEYSNAHAVTSNNVTTNGLRLKITYTATAVQVQPGAQNH